MLMFHVLLLESSSEPEHLEQSREAVSLSHQTLPQCVRVHRTALPAQVTSASSSVVPEQQNNDIQHACVLFPERKPIGNCTFDIRS